MWIFMARPPRPDAAQWTGRRAVAFLDAIVWPALWLVLIAGAPLNIGLVGWTAMGLAGVAAIRRAHRAIWRNERYWFTTSRWGVSIAILIALGLAIRVLA
jgi:hypothetical protein